MFHCTMSKAQFLPVSLIILRNSGVTVCSLVCVTLRHMSIGTGVVVAVTFQQVDDAPHAETGTEGDNEGLENGDCLIEKFHK